VLARRIPGEPVFPEPCRAYWADILSEKEIRRFEKRLPRSDSPAEALHLTEATACCSLGTVGREFFEMISEFGAEIDRAVRSTAGVQPAGPRPNRYFGADRPERQPVKPRHHRRRRPTGPFRSIPVTAPCARSRCCMTDSWRSSKRIRNCGPRHRRHGPDIAAMALTSPLFRLAARPAAANPLQHCRSGNRRGKQPAKRLVGSSRSEEQPFGGRRNPEAAGISCHSGGIRLGRGAAAAHRALVRQTSIRWGETAAAAPR